MFVSDLFENDNKQVLVIYPGRFQPFHKGHAQVFNHLTKQYGASNVFICTSDKVEPPRSPFNFAEKTKMIGLTGIDTSRVIQSTQPYRAMEIVGHYDKQNTILLFAVSEKDMAEDPRFSFAPKKDGSPSYFQPFKALSQCESLASHAYMITVPTFTFTVLGQPAQSATQIRAQYAQADEETRKMIINDLFGNYSDEVFAIMNTKLGAQVAEAAPPSLTDPKFRNAAMNKVMTDRAAKQGNVSARRVYKAVTRSTLPHDVASEIIDQLKLIGLDAQLTRFDLEQLAAMTGADINELVPELGESVAEDRATPKAPRKGTVAWEIAQQRKKQDQDPEHQKFVASLGNDNHHYGNAKVQHPVTEGNDQGRAVSKATRAVQSVGGQVKYLGPKHGDKANYEIKFPLEARKELERSLDVLGYSREQADKRDSTVWWSHPHWGISILLIDDPRNERCFGVLRQENEQVTESYGLNKRVKIVGKPAPSAWIGKTGWVGEVRHGAYKGAPKTYTVDLDNGAGSIQLPSSALRLIKDEPTNEGKMTRAMALAASLAVAAPSGAVLNPARVIDGRGNTVANPYSKTEKKPAEPKIDAMTMAAPVVKRPKNIKENISESAKVRSFTDKQGVTKYEVLNSKGVTVKTGFTDKKTAREWMHANYGDL